MPLEGEFRHEHELNEMVLNGGSRRQSPLVQKLDRVNMNSNEKARQKIPKHYVKKESPQKPC